MKDYEPPPAEKRSHVSLYTVSLAMPKTYSLMIAGKLQKPCGSESTAVSKWENLRAVSFFTVVGMLYILSLSINGWSGGLGANEV